MQVCVEYRENFKEAATNHHNFVSPPLHTATTTHDVFWKILHIRIYMYMYIVR